MLSFWLRLKSKYSFLLIGILIIAAFFRFYHIELMPSGLYWDEVVISYDAWGISIDGKDQWGESCPMIFTSFGDGKMPLIHYLLAGWFTLFDFNQFTIRYISAVFGIFLVAGIYFLARKIFGSRKISLVAAFLIATSSWAIHFSRFGLEAGIGVALMVWGLFFLYQSQSKKTIVIGIILLTLSAYTYHAMLILAPLLLLLTRPRKWHILFLGLLLVPLIWALVQTDWSRAEQTLFWEKPDFELSMKSIAPHLLIHFGRHLSPSFLMDTVQTNFRQTVPGYFILFPAELILLFLGLITSLHLQRDQKMIIWGWLIVGLIPSVIGDPSPHTIRAMGWMPVVKMVIAFGWVNLWKWKKLAAIITLFWYMSSLGSFWKYYQTDYPKISQYDFQYGYAELMQALKIIGDINQDNFVISPIYGQPYVYALVNWKINPTDFRGGGLANVSFRPIQWPEAPTKTLFAGSPAEINPTDQRVIDVIYSVDKIRPLWVIAR